MFTLQRKIYTSVNVFFKDFETCKNPEWEKTLSLKEESADKFKKEFELQDGSILNAFGKMMTHFIGSKGINDISQQKKIENIKRLSIWEAATILNNSDPNITTEDKRKALEGLFQLFKENKDAFPDNQNKDNKSQDNNEDKSEKFLKELIKVIGENRMASQQSNHNIVWELRQKGQPPADPESIKWSEILRSCLERYP